MSPSKLNNNFKSQFEEANRQFSVLQPMIGEQGSRSLSGKKDPLSSSAVLQTFNSNKLNENNKSRRLKCSISMLQFIFRLFKYLSELPIPIFSFLKLLIFRHRSYIDQIT